MKTTITKKITKRRITMTSVDDCKVRLVLKESDYEALRGHLLRADGKERVVFLLLGERETDGAQELYGHRCLFPFDSDYTEQHEMMVEPTAEYVLKTLSALADSRVPGYLHIHSHPFSERASFSDIDDRHLSGMRRSLENYFKALGKRDGHIFARMVWGQAEEGFTGECHAGDGSRSPIEEVRVVGERGIRAISCFRTENENARNKDLIGERFQRQVRFLGEDGQRAIQATRLVICGVGGLGSSVVAAAKGMGFKNIAIIDPDVIEESNLNRFQGAGKGDIGKAKVQAIAEAVKQFDPDMKLKPVQARVQDKEARETIVNADFIISCVDNDSARMEVQLLAARYLKPLLDLGSGIILESGTRKVKRMGGQAIFYYPGGPCLLCQGLDPAGVISDEIRQVQRATGYIQGTTETPASVVTINSVMAGVGLQIALSYLAGFAEVPVFLHYDLLRYQVEQYRFVSRPECPICGHNGIEGRGDEPAEISVGKRPGRSSKVKSLPPAVIAGKERLAHRIRLKAAHLVNTLIERIQNA